MEQGLSSLLVAKAYAACATGAICPEGSVPDSGSTSGTLVGWISTTTGNVVGVLLLVAGVLATLYLIWSGLQYVTSGGSADKAKQARAGVVNSVVGIVIILSAYFLVRIAVRAGTTVSCLDQPSTASCSKN